jgi:hypothetical protein
MQYFEFQNPKQDRVKCFEFKQARGYKLIW